MKRVNEVFTDDEHLEMKKNKGEMSWHEFLLKLVRFYDKSNEIVKEKEVEFNGK